MENTWINSASWSIFKPTEHLVFCLVVVVVVAAAAAGVAVAAIYVCVRERESNGVRVGMCACARVRVCKREYVRVCVHARTHTDIFSWNLHKLQANYTTLKLT
jgi:hypothetical protein